MAQLARVDGDAFSAKDLAEAARKAFEAEEGHARLPHAIRAQGTAAVMTGDLTSAEGLYEEALHRFTALGDGHGIGVTLGDLSDLALVRGDFVRAARLAEEAEALLEGPDHLPPLAAVRVNAGSAHFELGETAKAARHLGLALDGFLELDDQDGAAIALDGLAAIATRLGEFVKAANLLGKADVLLSSANVARVGYESSRRGELESRIRSELGERVWAEEHQAGAEMEPRTLLRGRP